MTHAINSLLSGLNPLAVLGVMMAVVFVETGLLVGFFLPGDSLLFAAGVLLAAGSVSVPLWLLSLAVFVAAVAGDQFGYLIGRRLGPLVFDRPDNRWFARRRVAQAEAFFAKHGPKAVVLARFVPVVRTLTPVVAGVARMRRRTFTLFNVLGAVLWASGVTTAGYFLGGVPLIRDHVELVTVAVVLLSLLPAGVEVLRQRRVTRTSAVAAAPEPKRVPVR